MIKATHFRFLILNRIAKQFNRRDREVGRAVFGARDDASGTQDRRKQHGDLFSDESPKIGFSFLLWLPATTSGRSLAPHPARNVRASAAHRELAGLRLDDSAGLSLHLRAGD